MNKTKCWYCNIEFEYDGEKYKDIFCPHCGIENSIYNPADYQPVKEEEMCGKLADKAREKSPYLRIEIGQETAVLVYKSWKEIVSSFGNDSFRYSFEMETESGIVPKTLDNPSMSFALKMDAIPYGSRVIISRHPKVDALGQEMEDKSFYDVKIV